MAGGRWSQRSDGDGGTLLWQLSRRSDCWRAVATWLRPGELHLSQTHSHEYPITLCATLIRSACASRRAGSIFIEHSLRLRRSTRATFQPKIGVELGHRPEAVMYPRMRQSGLRADP